jgi:hypothetical protein
MDSPITQLRKGLRRYFGPGAECCVHSQLYQIGHVAVDLIRLDILLQERNPDYQEDESLRDFIARKYGEGAAAFVAHWIKGEPTEETQREAA